MKKKLTTVFASCVLILALVVTGCSNNASSGGNSSNQGSSNSNSDSKTFTMRVGHTLLDTSVRHKVLEEFKKTVEEGTNGNVKVELHASNTLGDNNQLLQAVPLGTIEAAVQPTAFFGGVEEKLGVLDLPFMWNDMKDMEKDIMGDIGDDVMALIEAKGMKGLALWPVGIQSLSSSKPIDTPENLKGQKYRTMGTPIQLGLFSNWGTSPQPMALAELYSALQQGVVDGQSNDLGTIHDMKIHEVQKHILLTNHGATIDIFYVNKAWFDSLPQDYQNLLVTTAKELTTMKTDGEIDLLASKTKTIEDSGQVEITEPSQEMLEFLKQGAEPVIAEFKETYPDMSDIVDRILAD